MKNENIPVQTIRPSSATYLKTSEFPPMYRSSRGYAILRALGAHDKLHDNEINTVIAWSNEFHRNHNRITPHTDNLLKKLKDGVTLQDWFRVRLSAHFETDTAAPNAAAFPGDSKTPSYAKIYSLVWKDRKWPDLCEALLSH